MDGNEFQHFRKKLSKTQKEMGQLLGTSVRAVHGYEQGWRTVPAHVERQVLFLASMKRGRQKAIKPCWVVKKCPSVRKKNCPAWEYQEGKLCYLINGTICEGSTQQDWGEKMKICRNCEVLQSLMPI